MTEKKAMRIIFMGTPDFAVPSLDILVSGGYNVVAVITSTDKYGGRGGKQLLESPVKRYAIEAGIPVLQPKNLKSQAFIEELKSYEADLQVVVAFRMLPEVVWNMPKMGTINLHGSLLPKYRGAAPINWAIIHGEKETGVTTFMLRHEIDTGNIIFQERIPIDEEDTAGTVHDKMMKVGAELVLKTVNAIRLGDFPLEQQDADMVSKAPKIFHEDCQISFDKLPVEIYNFIRGLSPYPGAWTTIDGKEVKVYKSKYQRCIHNIPFGSIMSDNKNYLRIFCKQGYLDIEDLKMEGKRRMDIRSFLNGYAITLKS